MDCCKNYFFPNEVVDDISYVSIEEENYHLLGHYQIYDHVLRSYPSEHRVINLRTGKQENMYAIDLYALLVETGFTKEEIFDTIPNVKKSMEFMNNVKWHQASL